MQARKWLMGAALAVAIPTQLWAQALPAPAAQAPSQWARTDALLKSYVDSGKLTGAVAILARGHATPTVIAYGKTSPEADARPVDTDTLWRIYSMTKPVTAIAAMLLVEDGKLVLDQPVSDFIPAFRDMKVAIAPKTSLETRPATRPVTVRHLLTHSGGLGYAINAEGPLKARYQQLGVLPFAFDAKSEPQMRAVRPTTLAAFADRAAQLPLVAEPGTVWSYSMGLDVLARVIEVASGMPYERFLQSRLFDPLKMRDSLWHVPADRMDRFVTARGHRGDQTSVLDPADATSAYARPPSFPYGGAGLVMSARDYDRFQAMIQRGGTLDGVRVMKPETVRLATSNLLPAGVSFPGLDARAGGQSVAGGFGAGGTSSLVDTLGGPRAGTWGWGGAAGTIAFVDPKSDLRATIMVNYLPAEHYPLRKEATAAIYADMKK